MMTKQLLSSFLMFGFQWVIAFQVVDPHVLDLTRLKPPPQKTSGWGISSSDQSRVQPLELSVALETRENHLGGTIVYRLSITNMADSMVAVPTETDWTKIETGFSKRPPPGYLAVRLYLTAEVVNSPRRIISDVSLYGSDLVVGSIITLGPGETIQIRAAGSWEPFGRGAPVKLPAAVQVNAHLDFRYGPKNPRHKQRMSSNSLQVELEP